MRTRLRDTLLVTYLFAVIMAGTTLPTPLYAILSADLRLSPLMITVVYAVYALGVLTALLAFGRLSDQVGRKPVLLIAAGLSAASAVLFLVGAEQLPILFTARVVSGLSAGLTTGAATAWLTELEAGRGERSRAAVLATVANIGGLGLGPLIAGVVSQHLAHPLVLPFVFDLVLLASAALALAAPETARSGAGWRAGITVQRLGVPSEIRVAFLGAAVAGFAAFALLGFNTALVGQVLSEGLGDHSRQTAGVVAFILLASAAAAQVFAGRLPRRVLAPTGLSLLPIGAALLVLAVHAASLPLLVLALVVGGLGDGLAFRAGVSSVTDLAPAERRGEVLSAFFVVAYVGITVPVVAAGVLVSATTLEITVLSLAIVIAVLSAAAAVVLVRTQQPQV